MASDPDIWHEGGNLMISSNIALKLNTKQLKAIYDEVIMTCSTFTFLLFLYQFIIVSHQYERPQSTMFWSERPQYL